MEAGHARQVVALARLFQHHAAAEAVTHREDALVVHVLLITQYGFGGVEARGQFFRFRQRLLHERLGVLGVAGHLAVAVHVHRQGHIALLGEQAGAVAGVVVKAPPFVHHDHAGGGAVQVLVHEQHALAQTTGQFHGLFRHVRDGDTAQHQQAQHNTQSFHGRILLGWW